MNTRLQHGFTLVELILTLIIVSILAVSVIPRFFDRQIFDARAFSDGTLSLLRYAQKAAVAKRRTVCVRFTSTQAWLTIRNTNGDAACGAMASPSIALLPAGEAALSGPEGSVIFTMTAPASTGYSPLPSPSSFRFRALGDTNLGANEIITITGAATTITVESNTGYVH